MIALTLLLLALDLPPRESDASRTSKNGMLAAELGGAKLLVSYGRPKVKGRAIWGELIPYGEVWRTGADEATAISVSKDVNVEGKKLPAGVYALLTIPGKDEWTIIFNATPKQWGAYKYEQAKDVLRVKVKPRAAQMREELSFDKDGETLLLRFEKIAVPIAFSRA